MIAIPLILIFGLLQYSSRTANHKRTDWLVAAAAIAVPAELAAQTITTWLSALRPAKYDLYSYWLDGLLGFQASFAIGRVVEHHPWFKDLLAVSYGSCTLGMLAVFIAYLWLRSEAEAIDLVRVFGWNLFLAVPIYLLIPVCGPAFAFPEFPSAPPHVIPHVMAISAPPNGVPSVHFSTALLVAWFARRWAVGRIAGIAYVILTAAATLGSGQHYLLDLIVAVPYAVLIYRFGCKSRQAEVALPQCVAAGEPAGQESALSIK